ncbi:ADP-glyceromanno-heptose 6-epimerase [Thermoproteota archaeon]
MIVLTGGAGFIGSCFLWKLNAEGITDIIVVDHLQESDKWKNIQGKRFRDYIEKWDFLRLIEQGKISKPTHVVHMGACSSTTLADEEYFMKNNYGYSKTLAEWAFRHDAPFLYASSAATYGDGESGFDDSNETTHKLRPLNFYGQSKQLFDLWILDNNFESKVTGLKFFNVFGPNEYHKGEMMSLVCKKFNEVDKEGCIRLFKTYKKDYKDGGQKRDFIYIKDALEVMYYLFCNPDKTGIFNLGTGKAHSWNELARAMFEALGKKAQIEYIEMPEYLQPKYQYFTQATMQKLATTGFNYKFSPLKNSVKDYVGYLKEKAYL